MEQIKESAVEYTERMLGTVSILLKKFGKVIGETLTESFGARLVELSTNLAYGEVDVSAVKAFRDEVTTQVTLARVGQIRSLVERKVDNWTSSRFGEPFSTTSAAVAAQKWLEGVATPDNLAVMAWIDQGWTILKSDLESPWGKCDCGRNLVPVSITDRVTGQKNWRIFRQCQGCYASARDAREALSAATRGHKVQKPGSASRRHTDGLQAGRKPFKKGQKNK